MKKLIVLIVGAALAACAPVTITTADLNPIRTVSLHSIRAINDCDFGTGAGEFYWTVRVNNTVLSEISEANAIPLNDGQSRALSVIRAFRILLGDDLTLSGAVYESDRPAGPTTVGTFSQSFSPTNNHGADGFERTITLRNSPTCAVELKYSIR